MARGAVVVAMVLGAGWWRWYWVLWRGGVVAWWCWRWWCWRWWRWRWWLVLALYVVLLLLVVLVLLAGGW
jgi:hypothetical protein